LQASGTYGKKAPLPAIGGNEGVAVVNAVSLTFLFLSTYLDSYHYLYFAA